MTGLSPLLLWFVLFIIGEWTDACVESPNRWSQSAGVGQGREGAGSRSLPSSTSQHTDHARQSVAGRNTLLHQLTERRVRGGECRDGFPSSRLSQ